MTHADWHTMPPLTRAGSSFADGVTIKQASLRPTRSNLNSGSFTDQRPAEESLLDAPGRLQSGLPMQGHYRFGYLLQYFAVGFIYGGLPATTYGFLLGYLNVPAFVYATSSTVLALPWSFKFLVGILNDCVPICGYRRKPYMAIGWSICCACLVALVTRQLPPPYYCVGADGSYLVDEPPCSPESAQQGGPPCLLMTGAAVGYVIADVAADGLTVQCTRSTGSNRCPEGHTSKALPDP